MNEKILFVDDDQNVLSAYERILRRHYVVETALGGEEGLALMAERGSYAVVVSDMQMPRMDGSQFLAAVRERHPSTVRMLLTGYADAASAIAAVNRGGLFRFLTKPCSIQDLVASISAAIEQHRLMNSERELLDKTLRSSVRVFGEVLAIVNPTAFGRVERIQKIVSEIAAEAGDTVGWEVEVAVTLLHVGYVGVPDRVLAAADRGKPLDEEEQNLIDKAPQLALKLIRQIPRLDLVRDIIDKLDRPAIYPIDSNQLPCGSRLIRIARDFDLLVAHGIPRPQVYDQLRHRANRYDPKYFEALGRIVERQLRPESRQVALHELTPNMVLENDLFSTSGRFLLRQGNTISSPMRLRLETMVNTGEVLPTFRVLVMPGA
jgi:response regulator RpfG family c-di-GMP phosphodiesterase